jgi:hypothetical protein
MSHTEVTGAGWFYSEGGQGQSGPVAEQALKDLYASGAIGASTLVWRDGMAQWTPLQAATEWGAAARAAADSAAWSGDKHPWRRYISRSADYMVVGFPLVMVVLLPLFSILGTESRIARILSNNFVSGILLVCLFPLAEACLLSTWGFTPTRALMGIHIRNADGSKLSYLRALKRSWKVSLYGVGLGIPLLSFFTAVGAYYNLRDNGATTWDETLDISVRHRRWGVLRGTAVVIWCVVVFFLMAVLRTLGQS